MRGALRGRSGVVGAYHMLANPLKTCEFREPGRKEGRGRQEGRKEGKNSPMGADAEGNE